MNADNSLNDARFPSVFQMKSIITVIFIYYVIRLLYLAITISPFVPPDEVSHFGVCTIFSKVLSFPVNSPETYQHGLVTNIPWLYYWIMGKLLNLNLFGISDLLFLRLCNIPLGLATVYFVWQTLRLQTEDRLTQILLVVVMTNTMMLSFLSATVSYDNLTNLLAAMSIYYLLVFCRSGSVEQLGLSLCCQLAGTLTKITFLPLVIVLNLVLILHAVQLRKSPAQVSSPGKWANRRTIVLAGVILFGVSLNAHLYGGNYFRYGTIKPEMKDVTSFENAMQNRLSGREMVFNLFREGRVSREMALAMTMRIQHPGDREDAVFMIENYAQSRENGSEHIGLVNYIPFWAWRMFTGVFGIYGHLAIPAFWPLIAPIVMLAVMVLVSACINRRVWTSKRYSVYLAFIAGSYTVVLIAINYAGYLYTMAPYMGLQGRYIFPVIGPVYLLASYFLMRLFKERGLQLGLFVIAVSIFVLSDFPLFLARVTPEWYSRF